MPTSAATGPALPPHAPGSGVDEEWAYEYVPHPDFMDLPKAAPLTFTLTMHACLSLNPAERPTFEQARPSRPPPGCMRVRDA